MDILRNVCLSGSLLLCLPQRTRSRFCFAGASASGGNAFTLVELLIVIGVTGTLLGLLLPVISSARRSAQQSDSLLTNRQVHVVLRMYGADNRDYFPAVEIVGADRRGPVRVGGRTLRMGYFSALMACWPAAAYPDDGSLLQRIRHPMLGGRVAAGKSVVVEETLFYLTPASGAEPWLFGAGGRLGEQHSRDGLGAQRWSSVSFPDAKGLALDMFWWSRPTPFTLASFCDGSAALLTAVADRSLSEMPPGGPRAPVLSTVDGLRGRDR
ncbi:MAG: type II secretion system GspH family protein [Phycisphaerales bacterium]|nr:type II secretion system GspH family protein [Phycisphaerales bacterium]